MHGHTGALSVRPPAQLPLPGLQAVPGLLAPLSAGLHWTQPASQCPLLRSSPPSTLPPPVQWMLLSRLYFVCRPLLCSPFGASTAPKQPGGLRSPAGLRDPAPESPECFSLEGRRRQEPCSTQQGEPLARPPGLGGSATGGQQSRGDLVRMLGHLVSGIPGWSHSLAPQVGERVRPAGRPKPGLGPSVPSAWSWGQQGERCPYPSHRESCCKDSGC